VSSFLWHTIVDTMANMLSIPDRGESDLTNPRFYFDYQMRGARVTRDRYGFTSLWPRSRMMMGNPDDDLILGVDTSEGGRYEPMNFTETGSQRGYFIHGMCVDGAGSPLAAAIVELYLTATDAFVSQGQTDSNGIYSLPTPYTGQNHKIYANYGPNTLVGASIDTLTPVSTPW